METFWTIGVIVALAGVGLLLALTLGLARELGMVLIRLGPQGPREINTGPEPGIAVPDLEFQGVDGRVRSLRTNSTRKHLVLFVTPNCSVCEELMPGLPGFARAYASAIDFSVIAISAPEDLRADVESSLLRAGVFLAADKVLAANLRIHTVPFALLIDSDGIVESAGLINNASHLEGLTEMETFIDRRADRSPAHATS
jgi:methylamine dehydrogenase accessory protein MauD